MDRKCGDCKWWQRSGEYFDIRMGFCGHCNAVFPLWVEYNWNPFSVDRMMYEQQSADDCQTFADKGVTDVP